jgi:Flp pilus assembly protein CpaB
MRWTSFPLRLLVGVVLLAAGVVGTLSVVASLDTTTGYLVVTRDVPPGQPLAKEDLAVVYLHVREGDFPYLTDGEQSQVVGYASRHLLRPGQLVPVDSLVTPEAVDATTVTVVAHIAGAGWLQPGVRVEVWMSPGVDQGMFGVPRVVAPDAQVLAVRADEGFAADPRVVSVDLQVDRRDVASVIGALANNFPLQLTPQALAVGLPLGEP